MTGQGVQVIGRVWLPKLEGDRKAEAASVRLKSYCVHGFPDVPDGLELLESVVDAEAIVAQQGGGSGRGKGGYGGRGGGRGGYGRGPPRGRY